MYTKWSYMFMDKKQKIARKMLQKIKNNSKHARLNIDSLRREICGYKFNFADQPSESWSQSFTIPIAQNINGGKNKNLLHKTTEVKG
jgi:hypothetical protein